MFKKPIKDGTHRAFTLIEIAIAILIIGVLAVTFITVQNNSNAKAKESGIDVDFHTYMIAAKAAIIAHDTAEISTKEGFINKVNSYLDPEMQIEDHGVFCKADDPFGEKYEFRWISREVEGRTEHWIAFISKGTGARDGWIFEPDKVGDKKYSREGIDTGEYRYVMVMGYYDSIQINQMPNPSNDVPEIIINGNDVISPDPPEDTEWRLLKFNIETDDIEDYTNSALITSSEYAEYGTADGIYYRYGYSPSTGGGAIFAGGFEYISSYSGNMNSLKASSYTLETQENPETYTVTVPVGNDNRIDITYRAEDRDGDTDWFKAGSTVTMRAVAGSDYEFVHWMVDGAVTSTNTAQTITVEEDTVFTARFKMILKAESNQLVTGSGTTVKNYIKQEETKKTTYSAPVASGNWTWVESDGQITLTEYTGESDNYIDLNIPAYIDGKPVVAIRTPGHGYVGSLQERYFKNVIIPDGMLLGSGVFYKLTANSVKIGDNCIFESSSKMGNTKFRNSTIQNLYIGKNVVFMSNTSEFDSAKIKNIEIHSNVPSAAFYDAGVETLVMGYEVTEIKASTFKTNPGLTSSLDFSHVTSIGDNAFNGTAITGSLIIPANASIGVSAFSSSAIHFDQISIGNNSSVGKQAFLCVNADNVSIGANSIICDQAFCISTFNSLTINDGCILQVDGTQAGPMNRSNITNLYIGKNVILGETDPRHRVAYGSSIANLEIHSNVLQESFQKVNLQTIVIGSEVIGIASYGFSNNTTLKSVAIKNTADQVSIASTAFSSTPVASGKLVIQYNP